MKLKFFSILLFYLFSFSGFAIEIKPGDGYRFTDTSYWVSQESDIYNVKNNKDWIPRLPHELPKQDGDVWLKFEISHQNKELDGLYLSVLSEFELYWQDQLIFQTNDSENHGTSKARGNIDNYIHLPQGALQYGNHIYYVKILYSGSNVNLAKSIDFVLHSYSELVKDRYQQALYPMISLGVLVVIALYFLSLYQSQHINSQLLFALLCLLLSCWLVVENWRLLFGYPYQWHSFRLITIALIAWVFSFLLPAVLAQQYNLNIKRRYFIFHLLLLPILFLSIKSYDLITGLLLLVGLVTSVIITFFAAWHNIGSSKVMLLALIITLFPAAIEPARYLEKWFFLLFPLIIFALLYDLVLTFNQLQKSRDKALLRASALKLELIKKTIQPHFLLNTLTCLMEWIEKAPDRAVEMVQCLAEEFYLFSQMIDKPLISIEEEINVCRNHLQLMEMRSNRKFKLTYKNHGTNSFLPPGVILTLIENAFTHNEYRAPSYEFCISLDEVDSDYLLRVECPIEGAQNKDLIRTHQGLGIRYIRECLKENFSDVWQLTQCIENNMWCTNIKYPRVAVKQ